MESLFDRLERQKQRLLQAAPRIVLTMSATGLALVRLRIQRDGVPGQQYSRALVPTFFFGGQDLNAGGPRYRKQHRLGTWGGFRAAQGLPSDAVTLTYTGRMFNSLAPAAAGQAGPLATARIVASDREGADKVKWNTARYGDFLQPNAAETQQIGAVAEREVQRILQAP